MASEQSDVKPLKLRLFKDDDDEDLLYKKKLQALLNGDVWVVDKANNRLKEFMKRQDPKNLLTPEEACSCLLQISAATLK
ncbi:hypothetical protein V8E54_009759 [Elaphomyces granulatus]